MRLFIIFSLFLVSQISNAGDMTGKISMLGVVTEKYGNVQLINVMPDIAGHPCATSHAVSFDKSTSHGEHMYSMLLSAYLSGKNIKVGYSDTTCGLWGTQALIERTYFGF